MRGIWLTLIAMLTPLAAAQDYQVGDRIVCIRDFSPLIENAAEVDNISRGMWYTVRAVRKDAVSIAASRVGWIDKRDVMPLNKAAADLFTKQIFESPYDPRPYEARGLVWEGLGVLDRAIVDFTWALWLDPTNETIYCNRGVAWQQKGEYGFAIYNYSKALELQPDAITYANRGVAYSKMKDEDLAIADFDRAIELDPGYAHAYHLRGISKTLKGDHAAALMDITYSIRLDPRSADAYDARGWVRERLGEPSGIDDFNEALRTNPNHEHAHFRRGAALGRAGEYDKAIADYQEVIRLNPDYPGVYMSLGWTLQKTRAYEKALDSYEKALRQDELNAYAWNNLAWLRATCPEARFRNGDQAVKDATRACELSDWKDAERLDTLAAAHAEAGNFVTAVKWQLKAKELSGEQDKTAMEMRAELYRSGKPYRTSE
jgi:tetratricopeptide (TPR) repeat protein